MLYQIRQQMPVAAVSSTFFSSLLASHLWQRIWFSLKELTQHCVSGSHLLPQQLLQHQVSDVWVFVTDSGSYHGPYPNSTSPQLSAGGLVKRVFCKAPQCRLELQAYMQAQGLAPVIPVFVVLTRWGSWIEATQYLAENQDILYDFRPTLPLSPKAVRDLRELLEEKRDVLKAQAIFIVEHSAEILSTLTKLEETSNPSAASTVSWTTSTCCPRTEGLSTGVLGPETGSWMKRSGLPALSSSRRPWLTALQGCRL